MALIYFLYPSFLFLLLIIPLLIFVYLFSFFLNRRRALNFPNFKVMEKVSGMGVLSRNFVSLYINIIVACLLIFSLAGTIIVFNADTSSASFALAIDSSGSMRANDLAPNRLAAAKAAAKRFIEFLPAGTEAGIVSFAGNAEIVEKLGTSKIQLKSSIDAIEFSEFEGTNIYSTMFMLNQVLEGAKEKAAIIISDGQVNIGEISQAVSYASNNNIVVNTIAVGTVSGGATGLGTVSKIDEDSLKSLAFNTQGKFFSVNRAGELDSSFDSIVKKVQRDASINISAYLAIGALSFLLLNWILFNLRLKTLP